MVLCQAGWQPIHTIRQHERVVTPSGLRRVRWSGVVRFTNSWRTWQGIRATPEHRWFTKRGLVTTDDLVNPDECWTRESWGLRCLAWCVWASPFGFKDAITWATPRSDSTGTRPLPFIAWSIRVCKDTYRQSMKSIIEMATRIIPAPPILRPSHSTSTGASINPRVGMPVPALSAGAPLGGINAGPRPAPSPAAAPAMPQTNAPAEPAYDLDIDDAHCYFVRGDDGRAYLVSNSHCADALRTLCVGIRSRVTERVPNFYQTSFDPMTYDKTGEYESDFGLDPDGAEIIR